jgi:hypothetical protein
VTGIWKRKRVTPLQIAAIHGFAEAARSLLEHGANVEATDWVQYLHIQHLPKHHS